MFSYFFPIQFEIKHCAILLPWKLFLSNESRSFCTRLFLFRFINRSRNTAQKEYALMHSWEVLQSEIRMQIFVKLGLRTHESIDGLANRRVVLQTES